VLFEFVFERFLFSAEEDALIKFAYTITDGDDLGKLGFQGLVLCYSASDRISGRRTDIVRCEVGSDT
jgi:hypothetical protein